MWLGFELRAAPACKAYTLVHALHGIHGTHVMRTAYTLHIHCSCARYLGPSLVYGCGLDLAWLYLPAQAAQ